jgi:hypothetical protein
MLLVALDPPVILMAPAPAQVERFRPATAVGAGLKKIVTGELAAAHGPAPSGSFVVRVSVTNPAAISPAVGVYVAFNVVLFGLNAPAPPDHVADVALPPLEPASVTVLQPQTV